MERPEVLQRVRELLGAELAETDPVALLDSLALVELSLDLEEAFGVQLDPAPAATVGELVDLVRRELG